jgi:hypothetical protein
MGLLSEEPEREPTPKQQFDYMPVSHVVIAFTVLAAMLASAVLAAIAHTYHLVPIIQ